MFARLRSELQDLAGRLAPQRRWLVFGAVLVLMLGWVAAAAFAPVVSGVHELTLTDHVGALCLLAVSAVLSPMHHLFELAMAVGIILATIDRVRAWRDTRTLLRALVISDVPEKSALAEAADAAGVSRDRLLRIAQSPLPAFTMGGFRPKVYVHDRLESLLSRDELIAVLAHEGEHLRRRDPLRLSAMRFVSRSLYWLPVFRALESQLAEETELRADAVASNTSGVATASALLALVKNFGRAPMPSMSTGISPHEFLALRVRLLTGEDSNAKAHASRMAIVTTLGVLGLMWTVALAELHESTHPNHVEAGVNECREDRSHPFRQFVCIQETQSGTESLPVPGIPR